MSASTRLPKTDKKRFVIEWLGWDMQEVKATEVMRYDLTEAIATACRLMKKQDDAHGFFVHRFATDDEIERSFDAYR